MKMNKSLMDLAGGELGLRTIIEDFYSVVFGDAMIGFFFKGQDRQRLIGLELEFVMRFLGADQIYSGRSIKEAHAIHRIMGGQFNRRLQILKEAMARHDLHEEVQAAWIAHTLDLRSQVTPNAEGECEPPSTTD
ncbi:MAG: hemoglobin [Planctomycetota bacterium]|jgi:hemoglobin